MTYSEFLAQHTELHGLDQSTIDLCYQQYCEQLNEAIEQLEED